MHFLCSTSTTSVTFLFTTRHKPKDAVLHFNRICWLQGKDDDYSDLHHPHSPKIGHLPAENGGGAARETLNATGEHIGRLEGALEEEAWEDEEEAVEAKLPSTLFFGVRGEQVRAPCCVGCILPNWQTKRCREVEAWYSTWLRV